MKKTVLLTGVAGFIGRYVSRYFSKNGWDVVGIDVVSHENAPLQNLKDYYCLKLPDEKIKRVIEENAPDICIHCAGRASVGNSLLDPSNDFYESTVLTFELLNAMRNVRPDCKFIFLSSAAVYGNPEVLPVTEMQSLKPISPYGFHKLQCEQLCLEFNRVYGLRTSIVRIFSAYGPGLHRQVIWDICYKALTQKSLKLKGTGYESRDFIHAVDIARALMSVTKSSPMNGDIYNIGSGLEISIGDLANLILANLKNQCSLEFDGIVPEGNPLNWVADISKMKKLGFSPSVKLEEGLKTFVKWCAAELRNT